MREAIREWFRFLLDLLTGYLFREHFGAFNEKCEEKDWNGLIKFMVYPWIFIFSLWLTLFILLVGAPMVLLVRFLLIFGGVFKRIGKGIVWLDKKLRFKKERS